MADAMNAGWATAQLTGVLVNARRAERTIPATAAKTMAAISSFVFVAIPAIVTDPVVSANVVRSQWDRSGA
jgi:hypothetical protein